MISDALTRPSPGLDEPGGRVADPVWSATGLETPVFHDPSGRRRHVVRIGGTVGAVMSAGWLGCLVTGAIGFSSLPVSPPLDAQHLVPAATRHATLAQLRPAGALLVADRGDRATRRHRTNARADLT